MKSASSHRSRLAVLALSPLLLALLAACALNPATGKRQLSLIPEGQEIAMGREADGELVASMGLYPDEGLQQYVSSLGLRLAALSERPDLPWTFRVVDDPVVNAFALPGGFIYITRGILAHFNSEAELAAVVGHEIGHVTARHGVNQMSKAQLASIGLGIGSIASPELAQYGDLAGTGLGLLFLKYGRDDERQADDLGLRYMVRGNYSPGSMVEVFNMLGRVSGGGSGTPGWMSTHPAPENREERTLANISAQGLDASAGTVGAGDYLKRLDGLVFGPNPRHGFFKDGWFNHPDMRFRLRFPDGWTGVNQTNQVVALSPGKDAAMQLSVSRAATVAAASDAFFASQGIQRGEAWSPAMSGMQASGAVFGAVSGETQVQGLVTFVQHGEQVFQLLGYSSAAAFPQHRAAIARGIESFSRLTDRALLDVQPARIDLVSLPAAMTLEGFQRRYPSSVDIESLALLNGVSPDQTLPARRLMKRVVGGP